MDSILRLEPITIDIDATKDIYANEYCQSLFEVYPVYYNKVGYHTPWIGYFLVRDNEVVGCCGFVEKPIDGRVEIAYGTKKEYEGQGIASFSCKALTALALQTDSTLLVTAKTEPRSNASTTVLQRNGFIYTRVVQDHESAMRGNGFINLKTELTNKKERQLLIVSLFYTASL